MILKIDNKDYSHLVPRRGYKVGYKKVLGPNSCTTIDGTYHEDVLAHKAVINIELLPMTSEQLSELETSVENCELATYHDTKTGADVTKPVIVSLSPATLVVNYENKTVWSDSETSGVVLTIEER
jgi:hypothetical protein